MVQSNTMAKLVVAVVTSISVGFSPLPSVQHCPAQYTAARNTATQINKILPVDVWNNIWRKSRCANKLRRVGRQGSQATETAHSKTVTIIHFLPCRSNGIPSRRTVDDWDARLAESADARTRTCFAYEARARKSQKWLTEKPSLVSRLSSR